MVCHQFLEIDQRSALRPPLAVVGDKASKQLDVCCDLVVI